MKIDDTKQIYDYYGRDDVFFRLFYHSQDSERTVRSYRGQISASSIQDDEELLRFCRNRGFNNEDALIRVQIKNTGEVINNIYFFVPSQYSNTGSNTALDPMKFLEFQKESFKKEYELTKTYEEKIKRLEMKIQYLEFENTYIKEQLNRNEDSENDDDNYINSNNNSDWFNNFIEKAFNTYGDKIFNPGENKEKSTNDNKEEKYKQYKEHYDVNNF